MKTSLPILATVFARVGLALALLLPVAANAQTAARFKTTPLTIGIHVIQAEVAATQPQREQGLMFREKMDANQGMIFLFEKPVPVCMWMKNTLIPLSAAFIDEHGKIVNIEDMTPKSLESHCAKQPVKYVLEMNKGWFARKNIKPGAQIEGVPR